MLVLQHDINQTRKKRSNQTNFNYKGKPAAKKEHALLGYEWFRSGTPQAQDG